MKLVLIENFRIEPISKEIYDQFRKVYEPKIFPNRFDMNMSSALTNSEKEAICSLSKNLGNPYELRLGFFHGDELIGWSYGYQISNDTFRMVTTGIRSEFQRRGFQVIFSRHYATDNQVIIPKLRLGFLISGLELTDEFGLLIRLSYFFNEDRRNAMHMRSGLSQLSPELNKYVRKYD